MRIGFIGLGKLGLDCAEVMAEKYTVHGYDIYPRTSGSVKVCDTPKEMIDKDPVNTLFFSCCDEEFAIEEDFIFLEGASASDFLLI